MSTKRSSLLDSKHFTVKALAEGVYAVIAREGGAAVCNAGIVDLGSMRLIFDAFLTPSAAEDLLLAAISHLGHVPDYVIDSHYHNDHIWGNQAFAPPAHIVASKRTCHLIQTAGKKELEEAKASTKQSLTHFREELKKAENEDQRRAAHLFLGYYEGLVMDLPRLAVRLPDVLFEGRLAFHGAKRSAELIAYDDCHTGSDALLFLPDEGVVFMGDLLFVGCHPYLGDGNAANLVKVLKEARDFKAERFIPGHGQPGTRQDLERMIRYIEGCMETARKLIKSGKTDKDSIAAIEIPKEYKDWGLTMFYHSNLKALCSRETADSS